VANAKPANKRLQPARPYARQFILLLLVLAVLPLRGLLDNVNRVSMAHVHLRSHVPSDRVDDHHAHRHAHHHDIAHQHGVGTLGVVLIVEKDPSELEKNSPERVEVLVPNRNSALLVLTRGDYPCADPVAVSALAALPGERPPRA
jgi:ABC-type nickel/cobalt efflux system permease component RcnA